AQTDRFHQAIDRVELDAVPDTKRFIDENRHRPEHIGHGVLGGESQRQTADGQSRDGRGDVEAEVLRSYQYRHDADKNFERLADDGKKLFVECTVRFAGGALLPIPHEQVDQFDDGISDGGGHDDFQALVQDVVDESSPVEDFQPDFQEEDEHDNLDRAAEQADQQ